MSLCAPRLNETSCRIQGGTKEPSTTRAAVCRTPWSLRLAHMAWLVSSFNASSLAGEKMKMKSSSQQRPLCLNSPAAQWQSHPGFLDVDKINSYVISQQTGWLKPGTGHHLRWWMAFYQPIVPSDANIYYNLIWTTIYLSCTWSIKMNRTVVRINCNFLSFSSTKVHFWREDNSLSVLLLYFLNCSLSNQPHWSICRVLIQLWV